MSKLLRILIIGLVVLLLGFWLYTHIEEYTEKVDRGYQGEAKTNFLLAADYFLREMGQPTEKYDPYDSHQKLPEINDTLLIPGQRISLDSKRSESLMNWVNAGGHLIITAKSYNAGDSKIRDHILDPLGVKISWLVEAETFDDDKLVNIGLPGDDDFWLVDFVNYQVMEIDDTENKLINWMLKSGNNIHAAQFKQGNGLLTVLTDMRMFRNPYIDSYDHAAFLWLLANEQSQNANGVFYYALYENKISLMQWLWQNALLMMISLVISLLVIMWMIIPRFGPLININKPVRRQFVEHLTAAGNYAWRQGYYTSLLHETRTSLLRYIQYRYPEINSRSRQNQLEYFAELTGIQQSAIEKAMFDSNVDKAQDFVNKIRILEKLRKNL